ncbi:MAG: LAGLIDADG family homing endonuclease [Acholeplasmataceae bacterium]
MANDEALRRELPVVEIFDSVQGEGYYIGQLSTFVRLAGCNMEPPCIWCIAKGQRVTMADGSWKPIEEVQVGDFVLGVEDPETKEHIRFASAEVIATANQGIKSLWSLNGLRATGDHRILTQTQRSRYTAIQELRMHDILVAIPEPEPWDPASWLSGYLDGDGSFYGQKTRCGGYQHKFKVTSIDYDLLETAEQVMRSLGISPRWVNHNAGRGKFGSAKPLYALEITRSKEVQALKQVVEEHRGGPSYLGGFFDAEGSFDGVTVKLAQRDGFIKDEVTNALLEEGIRYKEYDSCCICLQLGGQRGALSFFAKYRPQLRRKWQNLLGRAVRSTECVDEVTPLEEEAEVYDLTTTTGNFFAEGICVHNCDTAYAQGGESGSPMTVAQIIEQCRGTHVVITGGEPLRHARTVELCDQLYRRHKLVTLETNGTVYRPGIRWTCNLISVSPKLPSSGHRPDLEVVGQYVRVANHFGSVQIKFVIQDREDLEVALATIKELTPLSGGNEIFWMFQPVALPGMSEGDLLDATSNLIGDIRNTGLWDRAHVRILPQLHRLLWGTQTGV